MQKTSSKHTLTRSCDECGHHEKVEHSDGAPPPLFQTPWLRVQRDQPSAPSFEVCSPTCAAAKASHLVKP